MNHFHEKLQEWFNIEIENLKILHNGEIIKLRGQTPFTQLRLNKYSQLRLLTVRPVTIKKNLSNINRPLLQKKQQSNSLEIFVKQQEIQQVCQEKQQKKQNQQKQQQYKKQNQEKNEEQKQQQIEQPSLIKVQAPPAQYLQQNQQIYSAYSFKQTTVDRLISQLFSNVKMPDKQLLILNESKLKYLIQKLSSGNVTLQKLLLQKINIVKMSLVNPNQLINHKQIPSTYIKQQLYDLQSFGFDNQNIIKALQIARNNIQIAFDILDNNNFQQYSFQFPLLKSETLFDQYQTIYLWFIQPYNKNHVKLMKYSQMYLQTYLNFLKHTCPIFFNIMVRWYPYLKTLLFYLQKIPLKQIKE